MLTFHPPKMREREVQSFFLSCCREEKKTGRGTLTSDDRCRKVHRRVDEPSSSSGSIVAVVTLLRSLVGSLAFLMRVLPECRLEQPFKFCQHSSGHGCEMEGI